MAAKRKNGRGGARPGSGPKPKPTAERRRNRVVVNLTDEEYDALAKAAGSEQLSTFIRRALARFITRRRKR